SAEQGDRNGQYLLGVIYNGGEGAAQGTDRAVYWWTKFAEQGLHMSLGNLRRLGKWP
ncbi:uncharacterized protein BJ171DRAFT_426321, partial [Polychytrium aggregatum]|uniref:uncharacterized protein n=1 Tax=Polychytrium aggregatum TaxID=110093 RepID=UPI0022FE06AA